MTISCEHLEIDTKDICLLCLGSRIENRCLDNPSSLPSLQGLKHLLRYLKVSPKQLFNCSSEFLQSMEIREDIDLKISLCSKCSSVTEKFNKFYQDYELIQLQFRDCVQTLYQSISNGNQSLERVRKYRDQMRPTKSSDLVNASIAANLRNETLKKCSLKLKSGTPKVRVASALQNRNLDKSKLPTTGIVDVCRCGNTQTQDSENIQVDLEQTNKGCESRLMGKHKPSFQLNNDTEKLPKMSPFESVLLREDLIGSHETSTEINADTEVPVTKVKPVKSTKNDHRLVQKTNFFNSIKQKLKAQSHPTAAAVLTSTTGVKDQSQLCSTVKICKYCGLKYNSRKILRDHTAVVHPEILISKFLPSNISLELCKPRVHAIWEQMFKESGSKCQLCMLQLSRPVNLKCHLIFTHTEQFATKVVENIQSLPVLPEKNESKTKFVCEHCGSICALRKSLNNHKYLMHPELTICKLFPSHTPINSCKRGVDVVLQQVLQPSESGFTCKFCTKSMLRKDALKLHVMSMHTKQMAQEVKKCIDLFPEHLEVESTECETNVSNCEDITDSKLHMPVEMDFDEEFIKIENPPSDEVELDPLNME